MSHFVEDRYKKILEARLQVAEALVDAEDEQDFFDILKNAMELLIPKCTLQVLYYHDGWNTIQWLYHSRKSVSRVKISVSSLHSPVSEVIKTGEAKMFFEQDFKGDWIFDQSDTDREKPKVWMGFPVKQDGKLIEIFILESYKSVDKTMLSHKDFELLLSLESIFGSYVKNYIKRADLLQVEKKYQDILHSSPDIFFQITLSGYYDFISSNVVDLLGYSTDDLIGKHIKVTTPMSQLPKVLNTINEVKETGKKGNIRVLQRNKLGDIIHVELHISPIIRRGEIAGVHGVARDISDQVAMYAEVTHLAAFPNTNPQPVIELDSEGNLIYQNAASKGLLNWLLFDENDYGKLLPNNYLSAIQEMIEQGGTTRRYVKDLGSHYLQWTLALPKDRTNIIFYASDITAMYKSELALKRSRDKAEAGVKIKEAFIDNISHEIRTPLNSILGFTKIIESEFQEHITPETQPYFDFITDSGNRLARTMKSILDLSQLESGSNNIVPERFDVQEMVNQLAMSFDKQASEKGLELTCNLTADSAMVEIERKYLYDAIAQLTENAITFTEKGGVAISCAAKENKVIVSISDSGPGMTPEFLKHVREPFTQGSEGHSKRYQGLGLGLPLVFRYLEVIGADIKIKSIIDEGSTFTITLNRLMLANDYEVSSDYRGKGEESTTGQQMEILIVEDDAITQKLYEANLYQDFKLHFAFSLSQAIQQIKKNKIGLIVLDLNLKDGEKGLDLLDYLEQSSPKNIQILIATSDPDKVKPEILQDERIGGVLSKPFNYHKMKQLMSELINRSS